jgi:uncharacterized protein
MNEFDFETIDRIMSVNNTGIDAPEFHGLMTGYLCAHTNSTADQRRGLYQGWLESSVSSGELEVFEKLYGDTQESLDEFSDFEFRVLVPDDDMPITTRSLALSRWCSGFLSGFGSAGRFSEASIGEDVIEALTDFTKIAGLAEEVPDSEENELDLMEISEFVRISVLLIYTECGDSRQR